MDINRAKKIIEQNRQSYNSIAADFDITRQTAWPEFEYLKPYIKEGDRVLDIGCGNGRLLQFLISNIQYPISNYVGIDQSEQLIKIARKHFPKADFKIADVFNLPFKEGEFDAVAGIAFLHHIPSGELRLKVLKEIYRVLKPGGVLFLTNWNLCQCKLIKKYKLRLWDFFFAHNGLDAGDFLIPFRLPCHSERSEESQDPSDKSPQDDRAVPRYYHHFNRCELKKLAKKAGFKMQKFKSGKNFITVLKK